MSRRREAIRERRALLLERVALERDELAGLLDPWMKALRAVDRGVALVRTLKQTGSLLGIVVGVAMAALAFIRPPSIGGWLEAARAGWRLIGSVRRASAGTSSRPAQS